MDLGLVLCKSCIDSDFIVFFMRATSRQMSDEIVTRCELNPKQLRGFESFRTGTQTVVANCHFCVEAGPSTSALPSVSAASETIGLLHKCLTYPASDISACSAAPGICMTFQNVNGDCTSNSHLIQKHPHTNSVSCTLVNLLNHHQRFFFQVP